MALSPEFAFHLTAALRLSQLNEGFRLLEAAETEIGELAPESSDGTRILLLLAQWIDVGYRDHRIIDKVLDGFLRTCRFRMSVEDHLRLSMVEGFRDLAGSRLDSAISVITSARSMAVGKYLIRSPEHRMGMVAPLSPGI